METIFKIAGKEFEFFMEISSHSDIPTVLNRMYNAFILFLYIPSDINNGTIFPSSVAD